MILRLKIWWYNLHHWQKICYKHTSEYNTFKCPKCRNEKVEKWEQKSNKERLKWNTRRIKLLEKLNAKS